MYPRLQGGETLKARVLFIGIGQTRVSDIAASIEEASGLELEPIITSGFRRPDRQRLGGFRAVFISRDLKQPGLVEALESIRGGHPDIPVVLVYGTDPDGQAFLFSNRFGCMLYSELDRFGRTLTSSELGEALQSTSPEDGLARKMMELSMCYGPCSTGE
jgi:hypothetical protein